MKARLYFEGRPVPGGAYDKPYSKKIVVDVIREVLKHA